MGKIRLLEEDIINQIAAGEIVERPGSALKEIVENSIDASSQNIDIFLQNGGKSKIVVVDDGEGMMREDLAMALKRHATSKLPGQNLFDIRSYGFRGEAIPSIASVSKFLLESNGNGISCDFSRISDIFPSKIKSGTRVSIEGLFSSIPARLKFLKSDAVELAYCVSIIENFALTKHTVNFTLRTEEKDILSFKNDTLESRISSIFKEELFKKSIHFKSEDNTTKVSGYLFHPLDCQYSQSMQRIFINGRIVKDKTISSAIKSGYGDLIMSGRFAAALLFIDIDPFHIDINVSPTKSEIRFRDPSYIQKMIRSAIQDNIKRFDRILLDFNIPTIKNEQHFDKSQIKTSENHQNPAENSEKFTDYLEDFDKFQKMHDDISLRETGTQIGIFPTKEPKNQNDGFFGKAICQVFDSYIISATDDEIFFIDQHAVHEKIVQSNIMENISKNNKQFLIKPEILEFPEHEIAIIKSAENEIKNVGFSVEFIQNSIIVSAIPAPLPEHKAIEFLANIANKISNMEDYDINIDTLIKQQIADFACHNSIRFGRQLDIDEMNSLIKQMEETESIHQCNHNRQAFASISRKALEKMFDR